MRISSLLPALLVTTLTTALPIGDYELRELMKRYANDSLADTIPALPEAEFVPISSAEVQFIETTAIAVNTVVPEEQTTVITTVGANGDSLTTTSTITSTIIITIGTKSSDGITPAGGNNNKAAGVADIATTGVSNIAASPIANVDDLYQALNAAGKAGEIADIKSVLGYTSLQLSSGYPTCAAETVTVTVTPTWCATSDDDLVGPSGVHLQKVTILSTNTHVTTSTITVPVTVTFTNVNGSTTSIVTASSLVATGIAQTSIETVTLTSTITIDPTTYVTVTSTSTTYTTESSAATSTVAGEAAAAAAAEVATVAASDLVTTDAFSSGYQNTTNVDLGALNILDKRSFFE